ncbi:MAG: LCP family protein [Lactobacillaceae bacterium]|jgi:LCP family protein required for cell wall assembly|nr:LCP family protein [Lactobacillaceae bacterium]
MAKHARSERLKQAASESDQVTPKKSHRVLKIILISLAVVLVAAGAYGIHLYAQAKSALDKTYSSVDKAAEVKTAKVVAATEPFSVLLLGTDTGDEGRTEVNGNSDTIIVATVNPKKNQTTLISIPRDTMAEIIGTSTFDFEKVNAANNVGGAKMALNTVSKLINVPLTNYISINMGGLKKIVEAVGGVEVEVPFSFSSNGSTFTKGKMKLDGKQALDYARMRYEDPEGDYGRQKRQRQIITAILKSAASTGTLANFTKLMDAISDNLTTNFTTEQMITIFKNYRSSATNVTSDHLQGISAYAGDAAVQVPATTELQRVSDIVRTELGLEKETISNSTTKENDYNEQQNGFIFDNPTEVQNYYVYPLNSSN